MSARRGRGDYLSGLTAEQQAARAYQKRSAEILGGARPAAVARELTKKFEQVRRAPLGELARQYAAEDAPKGEVVVLVGPPDPAAAQAESAAALDGELASALATLSVKDAAREVAARLGLPRRDVYARALELVTR